MRNLSWIRRHVDAWVILLYALLTVLLTFPLILNLTRAVPGHGADDPYVAWNIWWVKWALLDLGTNPLYSSYIFFPIGVNLGTYTLTLLNGILSIPLQLAWDVIPANNILVVFSITTAAFGTYLLMKDVLGLESGAGKVGAITAGLVFGFGAYRFNYLYLGGFNFVSNEWLPFYAIYLRRIFDNRSVMPRNGVMAGLFLVFTGWTESTLAAFLALLTILYLLYRLSAERLRFFRRQVLFNFVALAGVAFAGLSPLIVAVGRDLARYGNFLLSGPNRADFLSADLLSFLIPSQRNPWLGFLSRDLPFHSMDFAFVGYVTLFLALVGIITQRARSEFVFWAFAALVFAGVMLGPVLHVANQVVNFVPLPFGIVQSIPLLSANRLPVRYDHLLMLALAVLAGGGVSWLLARFANNRVLVLLLPLLVLAEHLGIPLSMSDLQAPTIYRSIATEPGDFSILDLPLSWSSSTFVQGALYTQSQFYQTVHHKRLLGGNTSRPPPFEFQYYNELPIIHSLILMEEGETVDDETLADDAQAAPELLRFFDLRYLVVRADKTETAVLDYLRRIFPLTPIFDEGDTLGFRVERSPVRDLTIDSGQALSRMYFSDDWGRAQSSADGSWFRWAGYSRSTLYAPVAQTDYDMCGLYAGVREGQTVRLFANDVQFAEFSLTTNWENHCASLPARLLHAGINSIVFDSDVVKLGDSAFRQDMHIGRTGVMAPGDIAITSAGFLAGKFASITFNGRETYATKRGFYMMAIGPGQSTSPSVQMFDTFRDESESARLADFIRRIPAGTIVEGAVCDEASQHLTQEAVEALGTLGLTIDLRTQFRVSYAFIGVKGAAPGTAVEDSDPAFPANVSVGKDVTTPNVSFALGTVRFTPVGK